MRRAVPLLVLSVAISAASGAAAQTGLFGSQGLDPTFCAQPNQRQTVVYVDDMMMASGRTDWATKLAAKLRATLTPGERVTVVRLSPGSGQSAEIWNGCWPAFSPEERERLGKERHFFSKNPLATLDDQQKFFARDLNAALSTIYEAAQRPAADVRVDPQHPPDKNIIRSLAFDEGRFAKSQTTIRAIVYSDLAESSDLGSVFKPNDPARDYGRKLGTYLRRSVFYAYGMSEDIASPGSLLEHTRQFWSTALQSMNASVGGLGTDLNMANAIPVDGRVYTLEMQKNGEAFDGQVSLLVDNDGGLVDSWLWINRYPIVGLSGSFRCKGAGDAQTCRLDGATAPGIVTNSPTDALVLAGQERNGLSGQIGVKGSYLFSIKTVPHEP